MRNQKHYDLLVISFIQLLVPRGCLVKGFSQVLFPHDVGRLPTHRWWTQKAAVRKKRNKSARRLEALN